MNITPSGAQRHLAVGAAEQKPSGGNYSKVFFPARWDRDQPPPSPSFTT